MYFFAAKLLNKSGMRKFIKPKNINSAQVCLQLKRLECAC